MFRSAVPPHIGQSPPPGSDADAKLFVRFRAIATAVTNKSNLKLRVFIILQCLVASLLVRRDLYVIDKDLVGRVGKNTSAAVMIAKRFDPLEHPFSRFGFGGRPGFASRSNLAVGEILDLNL
jgi:hypothetical protein